MNSDEDRHKYVYEKYSESKADQIPDHSLFFDIFKDTLSKEFKEKLFPENYALSRQLNALDFKEAEIRRVNKHNQRLFIATSFAGQLEKDFNASHTREPLSKQLADQKALVVNLGKRADGFRDKSHTEWTESELNLLVDERIAKDKLESLTFYDEHNGDGFKIRQLGMPSEFLFIIAYHQPYTTLGMAKTPEAKTLEMDFHHSWQSCPISYFLKTECCNLVTLAQSIIEQKK
jgi:hypothetical protein